MLTDPEINAALAEKAEGWVWKSLGAGLLHLVPTTNATDEHHAPDYLADPAASHALKEAMRAKGWRFEVSSSDSEPLFHRAIFQRIVGDKSGAWIIAEDPSELRAVALAACRALGVEGV